MLRNGDYPYSSEDPCQLGWVDWERYADNFGLASVPFEGEDPLSVFAEEGADLADEFADECRARKCCVA